MAQEETLKTQIARLTFQISTRYLLLDKENRDNLQFAVSLLTQASNVADDNPEIARSLLNAARRISRKRK